MVFVLQNFLFFLNSINLSAQNNGGDIVFVWFHLIERMKVHIFTTQR